MEHLCECGCGQEVSRSKVAPYDWNRFIHNHHARGRKHSKESIKRMSIAQKKRVITPEHRAKIAVSKMSSKLKNGYCHIWGDRGYKNDLRKEACEQCGITNMMSIHMTGTKLCTHHENGKMNCDPWDIKTMCRSCHAKLHRDLRRERSKTLWLEET